MSCSVLQVTALAVSWWRPFPLGSSSTSEGLAYFQKVLSLAIRKNPVLLVLDLTSISSSTLLSQSRWDWVREGFRIRAGGWVVGRGRVLSALTGPCLHHVGMSPQTGSGRRERKTGFLYTIFGKNKGSSQVPPLLRWTSKYFLGSLLKTKR